MKYIIAWIGSYQPGGFYRKARRSHKPEHIPDQKDATRFDTHDEAVQYVKEFIRNGMFGGDWQSVVEIIPVDEG